MKSLRAIIFIALILAVMPLGSFAQSCGNLVINPVTGLLDCAGSGGSGGSGTVQSVNGSNGVGSSTGSAFTSTGTLWADWPRNAQIGTSYALATGDRGKVVTFSNAASIAVTINEAGTTGFEAGWLTIVKNIGAGTVTITPTTSTIDGALTLVLYTGDWALISSAGGQYETINSKLAQSTGIVVTPNRTGKTVFADTTYLLSKGTDQSGATKYCASTDATGTSYTCNLSPTLDVANLVAGSVFIWNRTNVCSTGTGLQLQIDSTGAKNVYMADGSTVLTTTDCAAGRALILGYNGTNFRVLGGGTATVAAALTYRTCSITIGSDNASTVLVDADLGPQGRICFIPQASTITEVTVASDAGTPSVQIRKNVAGTTTSILSGALAAVGGGGASTIACAKTGTSATCLDGTTSSGTVTISTTSLAQGSWIELASGTAGGTAKRMSVAITYTVN